MKRYLCVFFWVNIIWYVQFEAYAQRIIGQWTVYTDNRNVKNVVAIGKSVFFAFDAALLEYDTQYKETAMWTTANGLSDASITTIGVNQTTKTLCVAYDNGNIDLIQNERTINLPDVKLTETLKSKYIYDIMSHENYFYLSTGLGIVKIDTKKNLISDTYYPRLNKEILQVAFANDSIYAISATELYVAKKTSLNLADPNTWRIDTRVPQIDNNEQRYEKIQFYNDSIYIVKKNITENDTLFVLRNNVCEKVIAVPSEQGINNLQVVDGKLTVHTKKYTLQLNPDYSQFFKIEQYGFGKVSANACEFFNGRYWFADQTSGAVKQNENGTFQQFNVEGPARKEWYAMKCYEGTLAIVPGTDQQMQEKQREPALFVLNDGKWKNIEKNNNELWKNGNSCNNTSVAFDPTNPNIVAIGGISKTPISIVDWTTGVVIDTFGQYNSTLSPFNSDTIFVSSVAYDKNGNLWIANSYAQKPLKMRDKDGQWHEFSLGTKAEYKLTKKIYCDYNDDVWISVYDLGLVGFSNNYTNIESTEDKIVILDYVLPANNSKIYNPVAFVMDYNLSLWIASDNGFAILSNPPSAFGTKPDYGQMQYPKVSYGEDVDFVFVAVLINDIEVDGGNRKWIATKNQGIFLLSENASVIVKHFSVDNSPLMSNNVIDVEIDQYTGEVYILTDRGLLSYRGDATAEDPTYSDVKVFPNPAYPQDEIIAIEGIRYNSDVKITDVAGNVVFQTTSNGGTATWNGKTTTGERVTTGVYLIWTASNFETIKGSNAKYVGKVMVVN